MKVLCASRLMTASTLGIRPVVAIGDDLILDAQVQREPKHRLMSAASLLLAVGAP